MASKRLAGDSTNQSTPPLKKSFLLSEPINLGSISTEEELDVKVLKVQNANLYAKLEEKNCQEEEFSSKFSKLERLRENDHNIISAMNLAWNQFDEDVTLMLHRFQGSNEDDETMCLSETTVAFLDKLSDRTTKAMQEEIEKRMFFSREITKKLLVVLDKALTRKDDLEKTLEDFVKKPITKLGKVETENDGQNTPEHDSEETKDDVFDVSSIELAIRQENALLKDENKNLHEAQTKLHTKYHSMSLEFSELKDNLATLQKENTELSTKQQDMEYDLQKATKQFEKLIKKLNESHEIAKAGALANLVSSGKISGASEDVQCELEKKDELAKSRLVELQDMQKSHQQLKETYEKLKQQLQQIPDDDVMKAPKYKLLEVQYHMLLSDAQIIRKSCEETRKIVSNNRQNHIKQLEALESENEKMKKRLRSEMGQLEKSLTDTRKELELLRVEYEHNLRAHEQVAPMAKEMRLLVNSLQNNNQQLKGEVQRYKNKLSDAQKKIRELEKNPPPVPEEDTDSYIDRIETVISSPNSESSQTSNDGTQCDDVKVLRSKLKSAREKRKEMKLLLDMYKGVSKETRDKAELLKNEKTLKDKVDTLKMKLSVVTTDVVKQARRFANQDHEKECQRLQSKINDLQKFISNMKQEEDALLAEMEFTGQAFEEMQEQNIRLMQQLREKDDTNLKLMSERIKSNQIQKLLREEKEVLNEKSLNSITHQQACAELTKRLEEREKVLQTALANMEKELMLRQQAMECHKRKAVELAEKVQEMAFKMDAVNKQLEETKNNLLDKGNHLEEETFKCNRVLEENAAFKKRLKRVEYMGASDEILVEEVKMYKAKLTCPCCNTNRKDAILTKCFHVFCFECLKTRYDTRQRKCPKCNATFGNNDFHKIYL